MKTLKDQIVDARATHDIRDVLALQGKERVIVCPLPQHPHKHNTPSFSIFWRRGMQWWRCHGSCDMEGDVVDLIGFMRVTNYDKKDPDKIREALNLLDTRFEVHIPEPEPEIILKGGEWRDFLPPGPEVVAYAASRGLDEATLKKFKIGQFGHYMTIPCFEEGILLGVKMRNIWKCEPNRRFWQLEGSRLGLYNFDAVYLESRRTVFIVKGEIPTMLLDQHGFLACSPTGGEASGQKTIQKWMTALSLAPLCIIGDNDGPGLELAKKRSALFHALTRFPPGRYKDLDEWYLAEPIDAHRVLKEWANETLSHWLTYR